MLNKWLTRKFPRIKQTIVRRWYNYVSALDRDAMMRFMNYGYVDLKPNGMPINLLPGDECHRHPIQLYHRVANGADWAGRQALEAGSGRGGGADYLTRYFKPRSLIAVDFAYNSIQFSKQQYQNRDLTFAVGNAECLMFPNASFDIVLNVESSLYYPNFERFLREVVRVLKPGGHFLYADIRYTEEIARWKTQLRQTGLTLIKEEDITPNVVRALELDREHKQRLIKRYVPQALRWLFNEFAGMTGAGLARAAARAGERIYLNFAFRKTGE